jgi:hypothetical protein
MEWIDINDRLPEKFITVIFCFGDDMSTGFLTPDGINNHNRMLGGKSATHWMPLPEPPNKPKLIWQSSTLQQPDVWTDRSDEEYELMNHLARFNWRQIEK